MKYKSQNKKIDKHTLREMKRQKMQGALKGDGEYLFVNNTRGDLTLIKPPISGPNPVPAGRTFVGDSYFVNTLMKTGEVRLIEVLKNERTDMQEKKLVLDQPDRFTSQGQTEHVLPKSKDINLHENQPKDSKPKDILITEDPLDGVEIIMG